VPDKNTITKTKSGHLYSGDWTWDWTQDWTVGLDWWTGHTESCAHL